MIPRAVRRLETTLLSSRQSLPRPARLYSTPSHRAQAPATATATAPPPTNDIPPHAYAKSIISEYLERTAETNYTIIPNPPHSKSGETSPWYTNSSIADMASVIDICLHNEHDIPRAQEVFDRLRSVGSSGVLTARVYNQFLASYLTLAGKQPSRAAHWLSESWKLYAELEQGADDLIPTAKTYAIMLKTLKGFGPESSYEDATASSTTVHTLLKNIRKRDVPILDVVTHSFLETQENMETIAKSLAAAALQDGHTDILTSLGHAQATIKADPALEGVPEVRPVEAHKVDEATGESTTSVPFNIDSMRKSLQRIVEARPMFDNDLMARQKHMESSVFSLAEEQFAHSNEQYQNNTIKGRQLKLWIKEWHDGMVVKLDEVLKQAQRFDKEDSGEIKAKGNVASLEPPTPEELELRKKYRETRDIFPFLSQVTPSKLALITILEIIRLQHNSPILNGMKTALALVTVGRAVENEYKADRCRKANIKVAYHDSRGPKRNVFTSMGYKHLHERRIAAARTQESDENWLADWSQQTRSRVGALLVNTLVSVANITRTMKDPETGETLSEQQPVIYNSYEFVRGQKLGVIKINEEVAKKIASDDLSQTIQARHLPMVVKPRPWIHYHDGGYLYNKSTAMRFKESQEQRTHLADATKDGKIELVFAGLDALGETPWKINRGIFDVVLQVWNSGDRMGKIPPAEYDEQEPVLKPEATIHEKSIHIMQHKLWAQRKAANHSDRCGVNYKIEIARAFLGDTIYMPHNLDFRGRAYPIPPHLNHIGDDLSRALLTFSEAKPLGERGFRWLKIHAANLFGYDKASFTDRESWTDEHREQIVQLAADPLNGSEWWKKADDPWQFLATCIELRNAFALPDPTKYESSLPVHQDGTCNGLQHYAALGGDVRGAEQVNLAASDKPSDVYTFIGDLVEKAIKVDADEGNKLAASLCGKISRKVVKQTVMTTVYGVTFIGAREQIEKQLRDRGDIPPEVCWPASSYLATKVLATIGDTFTGAKTIQDWLNLCARLITKSVPLNSVTAKIDEQGRQVITAGMKDLKKAQMTSVIWTTPHGLPIVQPYRKIVRKQVKTQLQTIHIADEHNSAEVNSSKQASAFPPNFIHSLDATHMMFTALECKRRELFFASVHDSYWTHACDVDDMAEVIRDTFIALHSKDILGDLYRDFVHRYGKNDGDNQVPIKIFSAAKSALLKKLKDAGTRLTAHESQRDALQLVSDVTTFTDDESMQQKIVETMLQAESVEEGAEVVDQEFVDEAEPEDGEADGKKKKTTKKAEPKAPRGRGLVKSRFIPLVDLLPPPPRKGTFRVEHIKESQYFFS